MKMYQFCAHMYYVAKDNVMVCTMPSHIMSCMSWCTCTVCIVLSCQGVYCIVMSWYVLYIVMSWCVLYIVMSWCAVCIVMSWCVLYYHVMVCTVCIIMSWCVLYVLSCHGVYCILLSCHMVSTVCIACHGRRWLMWNADWRPATPLGGIGVT